MKHPRGPAFGLLAAGRGVGVPLEDARIGNLEFRLGFQWVAIQNDSVR